MVGIISPDGLVVGLSPATLEFWVRFPNERNQGKQGSTLCSSTGFLTGPTPREQICNRYCSNKHTHTSFLVHSCFVLGPAIINTHILVCDGQTTSPHRSQLVVSRSTCYVLHYPPPPTRTRAISSTLHSTVTVS